ncbi:hypothetical protein LCGC14_1357360 [marine sediment metagenome]|uniref:Uncharacterized protein n=1 Tax=marine sediment metagenome TaxID=412755 RepID=A0A0F9NBB9_9ZZZZ
MSLKRFLAILLVAAVFFIGGVTVGRFIMPRKIEITVIDIKDLVDIVERYNEAKYEFERIKEWNELTVMDPSPEKGKN